MGVGSTGPPGAGRAKSDRRASPPEDGDELEVGRRHALLRTLARSRASIGLRRMNTEPTRSLKFGRRADDTAERNVETRGEKVDDDSNHYSFLVQTKSVMDGRRGGGDSQ